MNSLPCAKEPTILEFKPKPVIPSSGQIETTTTNSRWKSSLRPASVERRATNRAVTVRSHATVTNCAVTVTHLATEINRVPQAIDLATAKARDVARAIANDVMDRRDSIREPPE
jgi:hypothetical protein